MAESFQLIFYSQGGNVINNTTRASVLYDVNWGAFLPKKYNKFQCHFVFKSQNYAGILTDNGFVNMNIGRVSIFDGEQMSSNLGIVYPVYVTATSSYYNTTNNDNNNIWIDYPNNNNVTIKLTTFAGAAMANVPHYVIMMNLIGIQEDELHGLNYNPELHKNILH